MKITLSSIMDKFTSTMMLMFAIIASAVTTMLVLRNYSSEASEWQTFVAFYVVLFIVVFITWFRKRLESARTAQMLQFSIFLLGSILILTGLLSLFRGGFQMGLQLIIILILPGLALIRVALNFNKQG